MQDETAHLFRYLLQNASEHEFQSIVAEIFRSNGYDVQEEYNAGDYRFDLHVVREGQSMYVEVTRSRIVNKSFLKRLEELSDLVDSPILLVVAHDLPLSRKHSLELRRDIKVWDVADLYFATDTQTIKRILDSFGRYFSRQSEPQVDGFLLYSQLESIVCARKDALKFQEWVKDILSYLFVPPLAPPFYEKRDEGGFNRRDIIFPNRSYDGFWRALSIDYTAPFITVDAKNHCDPIGKQEVLGLSHYLKPYGLGLFGMLVSREGLTNAGKHAIREHWIGQRKMIVCVTTSDLRDMVEIKMKGGTPETSIDNLITAFRLSL